MLPNLALPSTPPSRAGQAVPRLSLRRAAVAYVREHAAAYNLDSSAIGTLGFSAGGLVAGAAALDYTSEEERPDFVVSIYGDLDLLPSMAPPARPMPFFLAAAANDHAGLQVPAIDMFRVWNAGGYPAELHIYERGGHGFGMRRRGLPVDNWAVEFAAWLEDHGWL